jgi:hypothetical protein
MDNVQNCDSYIKLYDLGFSGGVISTRHVKVILMSGTCYSGKSDVVPR